MYCYRSDVSIDIEECLIYLLIKEGLVYKLIERQFSTVFFPQNLLKIMIYSYMYKFTSIYTKFLYMYMGISLQVALQY